MNAKFIGKFGVAIAMLLLTLAFLEFSSSPAFAQTNDINIYLPDGIAIHTLDFGPTGDIYARNLGGDNWEVWEGRATSDGLTYGDLVLNNHVLAKLYCAINQQRCVTLPPGNYPAHFLSPHLVISPNGSAIPMDGVEISYRKLDRRGRPKGKTLIATYSVEWTKPEARSKTELLETEPSKFIFPR